MQIHLKNKHGHIYLEAIPGNVLIENERDATDVVGLCGHHDTSQILLYADNLTERFFDLKTRVAGDVLQKFMNYGIRAALVLSPEVVYNKRFEEMAAEINRGRHFGVFYDRNDAEEWLLSS